jgi:hypothetical protein
MSSSLKTASVSSKYIALPSRIFFTSTPLNFDYCWPVLIERRHLKACSLHPTDSYSKARRSCPARNLVP